MDAVELSGIWWNPDHPESKVSGTLRFTEDEGLRLQVSGAVEIVQRFARLGHRPLIHGVTERSDHVTLVDCFPGKSAWTQEGYFMQELLPDVAYIGAHFREKDEMRFDSADASLSHLLDWVTTEPFVKLPHFGTFDRPGVYQLTFAVAPPVAAETPFGTIELRRTGEAEPADRGAVTVSPQAHFHLTAKELLTLVEWDRHALHPLRNFLSFATHRPCSLTSLHFYSPRITFPSVPHTPSPIQALFATTSHSSLSERRFPRDMLLPFREIAQSFPEILHCWWQMAAEFRIALNLYFTTRYSPVIYTVNHFAINLQVLEAYHRWRYENRILSRAEFRKMKEEVLARAPEQYRDWLGDLMKNANEPRLSQRLHAIFEDVKEVMDPLVHSKHDFIKQVTGTRNLLAHLDPSKQEKIAEGQALRELSDRVEFMVRACFLRELGLPPERRLALFQNDWHYSSLTVRS